VDNREVGGAFTKAGWAFMQEALKKADDYFSGEQWVLGPQAPVNIDRAKLEQELRDRYATDFTSQWQQFLKAGAVVRFASFKDAHTKLNSLSGNQSPLLELFCLVSQHTAVETPQIKNPFQPVQLVTAPNCEQLLIGEPNMAYMSALGNLSVLLEPIAAAPGAPSEAMKEQVLGSALQAKMITKQLQQKFQGDPQNAAQVQKLLEDPINYVEALIRNSGPMELAGKGKLFCSQFSELTAKYPFNPNGKQEATLQELNAMFQPPQGVFWAFYDANLKNHLVRQGSQFAPKSDSPFPITPAFLNFWNRAAFFADAVYPDNSPQPRMTYTLKLNRVEGIETSLTVDGQTITGGGMPRQFVWSGNPNSRFRGAIGGGGELEFQAHDGLWAPFRFFASADKATPAAAGYSFEWTPRQGTRPITLPNGMPVTIHVEVEGKSASVFQKSFMSGLNCVPEVAR